MRFYFDTKPTAHKVDCILCDKPILKGEKRLQAFQSTYPGERQGSLCFKCILKEVRKTHTVTKK